MNVTWLYVGAVYTMAVAVARKAGLELHWRIALLFYALVLLFLFQPLTQDYVNVPVDFLKAVPPWTYVTDGRFINREMNDVPMQHAVWAHQVREAWRSLSPPLWNHLAGSKYPLLANGQSSALSPLRLLTLPLSSLGHAMTAQAAFTILVGLTFTFLYCRRRGWSESASTAASVAFAFGGFLMVWLHFPHVTTACFLPAVILLIDLFAERVTFMRFTMAALIWAAIITGGHPETAAHIVLLALLYLIWIMAVERAASVRLLLPLGGAVLVAAFLALPFLAPFAEAVIRSQRFEALQVTPLDVKALPWANWQSAVVIVQPHIYGRVPREPNWGWSVPDPLTGFAGTLGIAGWFATFIGAVQRRAWRSREMFFALATLLMLGLIMGWPGLGAAIHRVMPMIAHARLRLLFGFLLAIQSAAALDRAQRGERLPFAAGIAGVSICAAVVFGVAGFPGRRQLAAALVAAVPSIVVLAVTSLLVLRPRWREAASAGVVAAVIIEMFSISKGWSPVLPSEQMYPRTPLIRALEDLKVKIPPDQPFRIAGIGPQLFPNTSAMFGLEDVRAHDPMAIARYLGFLRRTADYNPWDYFAFLNSEKPSVYDFLNVRYLILVPHVDLEDGQRYAVVYEGGDGRIVENRRVLPRFYAVRDVIVRSFGEGLGDTLGRHDDWANAAFIEEKPAGGDFPTPSPASAKAAAVRIVEADGSRFRLLVQAERPSLVVSSIPWFPGWKVKRGDGVIKPLRVNGGFLGFVVPSGENTVRVWYSPPTFWGGVWVSLATITAMFALGLRRFVLQRAAPLRGPP